MIMPIKELEDAKVRRVGIKQSTRALMEGRVSKVFIADNADQYVIRRIVDMARDHNVEIVRVPTMRDIGQACRIDVGAATAVIIKD